MRHIDREQLLATLILVPGVAAVGVFVYGFIGWTFYISLTDWESLGAELGFVGLANYLELFTKFRFQAGLRNTLFFTLLFLFVSVVLGLVLSILLDQDLPGSGLFRSIFLFPMAISFVVTGVAWRWLFNPKTGINLLLERVGLDFLRSGWYTNPEILLGFDLGAIEFGLPIALISVIIAATWQMSGFTMAQILGGLAGIPDDVREAARIDGASEWQIYRHIIIPMLRPVLLGALIILGHISLKIFDLIFVMTGSGPAFATDFPSVYMFETTFTGNQFAQGGAIAVILLIMVSVVIIPYLVSSVRSGER